jgi:TatD family-associated radical SAM protein
MKKKRCRSHPQSGENAAAGPTYVYWGGPNLYLNLTSRCSASCSFCLRNWSWEVYGYDLYLNEEEEPGVDQVVAALEAELGRCTPVEVVFTGLGEPTLRLDVVVALIAWLSERGLSTRIDTNGHAALLNPGRDVVGELVRAGLVATSVSLNAPDEAAYDHLCRPAVAGAYCAVKEFIRDAAAAGIRVTATAILLPGIDVERTALVAAELGVPFRVRPFVDFRASTAGEDT